MTNEYKMEFLNLDYRVGDYISAFDTLELADDREKKIQPTYTPPTLGIQRNGRLQYQLNSGLQSAEISLQSSGPIPDRRLYFQGNELANDIKDRKGTASSISILDSIESIALSNRDLQHPDGRARVWAVEPTIAGLWLGAFLQGGDRVLDYTSHTSTTAVTSIDCTYSNRFVYGANSSEEFYLGWIIPSKWDAGANDPDAPRILGNFILAVNNASQGRNLYMRNTLSVSNGSPGAIALAPIEYEIRQRYSQFISAGDLVEVQVIHKAFARSESIGDVKYLGARTGLTLLPVRLKSE